MRLLLPELILIVTALGLLSYDFIKIVSARLVLFWLSLAGLGLALASLFYLVITAKLLPQVFFFGFFLVDPLALLFKGLILGTGLLVVLMNYDYFALQVKRNEGEFYFLLLTSIIGLLLAVSSTNLLLIYLGIELASLTSYLLAGWQKDDPRSGEAALKYFLFGAVASAIFLYGISLFYGLTGSFNLVNILGTISLTQPLGFIAVLFIILGLGFKIAMAPMQFWCPDVYQGAPTSVTAYLSVAPKAAGFAILLRCVGLLRVDLGFLLAGLAVLTMTWGNIVAWRQTNIKRLLAYSSIAQAGYIMIGLLAARAIAAPIVYYLLAYTFTNLGVFAIAIYLSTAVKSEEIDDYAGLAQRSPYMAAAFSLFLLSLIGIPPTAGFVGKFLLFGVAVSNGYFWVAVAAVINSVISVFYYLNIIRLMYFVEGDTSTIKLPAILWLVVSFCLCATMLLGIFPNIILW